MDSNRRQTIDNIFAHAINLPPDQWDAYLAEACDGDPELQTKIRRLLEADRQAGDFIETAVRDQVEELERQELSRLSGKRLGPYLLREEIGRGGMSSVWLAVRDDQQFQKTAAIKIIRRGMDTADIRRRFRNERQILANLEHPNIARLLDGGETDDGLPYFVMEYIKGEPIDVYCDRRRLSLQARLKLFQTVCQAVSHAHRRLVVHRDLKPNNILVTEDGQPKLLDFGIAKLLESTDGELTTYTKRQALRLMTPAYASPEQIHGQMITTATDVYSLGVILYKLITGRSPYQSAANTGASIEKILSEGDPLKPSQTVTRSISDFERENGESLVELAEKRAMNVDQLRRKLRGDLDTIVLTAMHKDIKLRYPSAARLNEDLERHMSGLPITARPPTLSYQLSSFVRRNWVGVTVGAAFLTLLLVLLVGLSVSSTRIKKERDHAKQVADMLADMFHIANPEDRGGNITGSELLDRGVEKVHQLENQPETQAMLFETLGNLYRQLGIYRRSEEMYKKSLAIAKGQRRIPQAKIAELHREVGIALVETGSYENAELHFREALRIRRKVFGNNHQHTIKSINNLALINHDLGRYEAAGPLYEEALSLQRKNNKDGMPDAALRVNLGYFYYDLGRYDEALRMVQDAQDEKPRVDREQDPSGNLLEIRGLVLRATGDFKRAEACFKSLLAYREEHFLERHPTIAGAQHHLGSLLAEMSRFEEARRLLESACEIRATSLTQKHLETAYSMEERAWLWSLMGDYTRSEKELKQVMAILKEVLPENHPHHGLPMLKMGVVLHKMGRCQEAEMFLRKGLDLVPGRDWRNMEASVSLGICLAEQGQAMKSGRFIAMGLAAASERLGSNHPLIKQAESIRAETAQVRGE